MMDISKIKKGDRIKFKAVTRWSNRAVWRVVTAIGRQASRDDSRIQVRFGGCSNFYVRDYEISEHETRPLFNPIGQ